MGFSLYQTPALALLVKQVLDADGERTTRAPLPPRRTESLDSQMSPAEARRTLIRALGSA